MRSVGGRPVAAPLSVEALRALDDFGVFRRRFFGRLTVPWQERAAYEVLRLLESPERSFVVMNEPPGSGKSTLYVFPLIRLLKVKKVRTMLK